VATVVFGSDRLATENPVMAERAALELVETPSARPREEAVETSGLMLVAVGGRGLRESGDRRALRGLLLNRRVDIVDLIKETVFTGEQYRGEDIGTATLFLDDVRIATTCSTRRDPGPGHQSVGGGVPAGDRWGERWLGRAYVVRDWVHHGLRAPHRSTGARIGMLYVGILEQPYADLRTRTTLLFVAITSAGWRWRRHLLPHIPAAVDAGAGIG